jgi:receptor protein-tyrosine kinase
MKTIEKALAKSEEAKKKISESAHDSDEKAEDIKDVANESPNVDKVESTTGPIESSNSTIHINLDGLEQSGFVSMSSARRLVNEEFRSIKRKLLSNAFGPLSESLNNCNVIMVSSSKPNEGKTFTAINLALSIALEQDKTVLLVDADVLRPSIMKTFNAPFEKGLMEYLLGECQSLSDVIYKTNVENLRIIPAGKSHHLSSELLASEKMSEVVNEFSNRYSDRVVIFDTPPLLGINETSILANLAGQAIIVVEEGKTTITDLEESLSQMNNPEN